MTGTPLHPDTAREQLRQMTDYLVTGLIINDANGPRRYAEWITGVKTPEEAEAGAKELVHRMVVEGRHAVLLVGGVFQLSADGLIKVCDTYATYGDDYERPNGYAPAAGWTPPRGFEGIVDRVEVR